MFLLDALSHDNSIGFVIEQRTRLEACGREIQKQLWETIDSYGPTYESKEFSNLGIVHGWAGLLNSTLCWCAASGDPFPSSLEDRLHQLAECAEPVSRGLQWKWDLFRGPQPTTSIMPGWCNGSAGYVFLWTQAHMATGDQRYLELAEGAAWQWTIRLIRTLRYRVEAANPPGSGSDTEPVASDTIAGHHRHEIWTSAHSPSEFLQSEFLVNGSPNRELSS